VHVIGALAKELQDMRRGGARMCQFGGGVGTMAEGFAGLSGGRVAGGGVGAD